MQMFKTGAREAFWLGACHKRMLMLEMKKEAVSLFYFIGWN